MSRGRELGWRFWLYLAFVIGGTAAMIIWGSDGPLLGHDPWYNR